MTDSLSRGDQFWGIYTFIRCYAKNTKNTRVPGIIPIVSCNIFSHFCVKASFSFHLICVPKRQRIYFITSFD